MKKTKWTKEMVENESKKYVSRFQFQKNSKYAYNKSLKEGWLDEFVWLRTPEHKENNVKDKVHYVYAYIDEESKSIYIGRTNNIKIRHNRHNNIQRKNKKYDTVKAYFLNNDKDLPSPTILSENLTLEESQYYEDYFLKYYKNNGWNIINKGKTGVGIGSIGGFVQKLTYEYCKSIALTCKTRKEFEKKDSSAYRKSCAMKWIEEFIPNKIYNEKTYEECLEIAKQYKTNEEFRKNDLLIYNYCQRHKWLKDFNWLTRKCAFEKRNNISKDEIIEKSKSFKFKNEFKKAYPSHYAKALKKGWLNDLGFDKYQKLTYEYCKSVALTCKTRKEFKKIDLSAYRKSCTMNWIDEFIPNKVYDKRSYEECIEIAKKYKSNKDFRKNDLLVYNYCQRHKWLKDFNWLTRNNISKDEVIEKSKVFKLKSDFKKAYPNHYAKALKKGWLNDLGFDKYRKYTYEEWYEIAKEFETKQNFRKIYPELVNMAYRYNWFEKCDLFKPFMRKLTKEKCLEIANNYSTINELRKSDESVYQYLLKNDLIKETNLKHIRNLKIKNMIIEFYKENLDFPLSGGDTFSNSNRKSIKRILNVLTNYIGKKTNIKINMNDKRKILISNLIYFCELEEIDYTQILEIEVIQNGEVFQIIVNKGTNENVQILEID